MATNDATTEAVTRSTGVVIRPLLLAAIGTIAVGALAGRRDLIRGGARLGAVQLAAAAIDAAVHRLESPGAGVAAPPPMVTEAMATWLAETLVGAALDRLLGPSEAAADRVVSVSPRLRP